MFSSRRQLRGGAIVWTSLWVAAAAVGLAALGAVGARAVGSADGIGAKVTELRLSDERGKEHTLAEFHDRKALVLVFLGTECPISNSYAEPLTSMAAKFAPRGVQFLGVDANPEEEQAALAQYVKEFRLSFPLLRDKDQALSNRVHARVTPEAFVLDKNRVVQYRGRIDDQFASRTQRKKAVTAHDLENAIEAVLAGKAPAEPVTRAFGCAIVRPEKQVASGAVTFHKNVEPVLQERCQGCHRPGQVGPFSLLTYKDAKSWATEIAGFTASRQMPPWKAEPGHGEFMDSRRLTDDEIATIGKWVASGAPEGSLKDAPAPKKWADGWMLGEPDLVLKMPESYHVSATGEDDFHCFVLPTGLTEDKQVTAVEIRPGNPKVVHHVLNFIDQTGKGRELDKADPGPGYKSSGGGPGFFPSGGMGGWAPGNFARWSPKGTGRLLAKGADLVMQVHYHKTGKPEDDQTSIGIFFAKEPVEKQLRTWPFTTLNINIPPNEGRHEVHTSLNVPFDMHAFAITPHMHLLGREMKVTATYPDGTSKDMVLIKDWDYRWQDTYRYQEPVAIPKGTKLDLVAYYDNSTGNPLNPSNPPKWVRFGEQTTDEMCFAFIEFTMDQEPAASPFRASKLFSSK